MTESTRSKTSGFDPLLEETVLQPWRDQCRQSREPWLATPVLRKNWMAMSTSSSLTERVCAGIALSRCVMRTHDEQQAVEGFLTQLQVDMDAIHDQCTTTDNLLALMVMGGDPPFSLWNRYFHPLFSIPDFQETLDPCIIAILHYFLRHPCVATLTATVLPSWIQSNCGFPLYPVLCNPSIDWTQLFQKPGDNPWWQGLTRFHPSMPKGEPPDLGESPTVKLGWLLRSDLSRDEYWDYGLVSGLDEEFRFAMEQSPVLVKGPCPELNLRNPSRALIEWFGADNEFCSLWRWYIPTLCLPWESESIAANPSPGALFAMMLMGRPYLLEEEATPFNKSPWNSLFEQHPSLNLSDAYLSFKQRITHESPTTTQEPTKGLD